MATFSNFKQNSVGTSVVTLLTADSPTIITGCSIANINGSTTSVSLYVQEASEIYYVAKNRSIDGGHSFEAISGNKLFLKTGDILKAVSSTDDSFDIIVSVLDAI